MTVPTELFGERALSVEECCRCGRQQRRQNMLYQVLDGEPRWFCVDCACELVAGVAEDVNALVKARDVTDRAHQARAAVLGEYLARTLTPGSVG
jgi:hypothetical protein